MCACVTQLHTQCSHKYKYTQMKLSENSVRKTILHVHQSQMASIRPVSSTHLLSWSNHNLDTSTLLSQSSAASKLKSPLSLLCSSFSCQVAIQQFSPPPPLRHLDLRHRASSSVPSSKTLPSHDVSLTGSRERSPADRKLFMCQAAPPYELLLAKS